MPQQSINIVVEAGVAAADFSTLAPKNNPTFYGNVTLPGSTTIGNVNPVELSYLDGVTSNIQSQINAINGVSVLTGNLYLPQLDSEGTSGSIIFEGTTNDTYDVTLGLNYALNTPSQSVKISLPVDSADTQLVGTANTQTLTNKTISFAAGSTSTPPIILTSGTNLTVQSAGAIEYDGSHFYITPDTTSGRGHLLAIRTFRLTADGSSIGTTIGDYFGSSSSVSLAANSVYRIKFYTYFTKTTSGTLTWTLSATNAPTMISANYVGNAVGGLAAGTQISAFTGTSSGTATSIAFPTTAALSAANHTHIIDAYVITNTATNFKLQATCGAGTITPKTGSFYLVERVSGTTGVFA